MKERIMALGDKPEPLTEEEGEDTRGNKSTWVSDLPNNEAP
jgi:hypothetical protein